MKRMKKISAFILALVMTLALTACGGETKKESTGAGDSVKEAKAVVEKFADAFAECDAEEMREYIHGQAIEEDVAEFEAELSEIGTAFMNETGGVISEEKASEYLEDIVEAVFDEVKIIVGEGKDEGGKVTVEMRMSMPNFDAIDMSEFENPDEAMILGVLGVDMDNPDGLEELENLSPDELMDRAVEGMIDIIIDKIREADSVTENKAVTVEKIDGEWKITNME